MIVWGLVFLMWGAPARAQGGRVELSDAAIEQRKAELEGTFRAVAAEADQEFQNSVAFHTQLKDERLEFERRMITDRKNMLESLKGLSPADRKAAFERFHAVEAGKRRDFARRVSEQKQAFRREFLEERQDAKRALKRRRETLEQEHRQGR